MWILPKNLSLDTLASAQDTKVSDLDSEQFSQICAKSLTWRGKDSLSRTWLQRWKRVSWMQHLFLRTLRPSLTDAFVDAWTSSLAASPANHLAPLESEQLPKTPGTCSPASQKGSKSASPELFSSKTWKDSCPAPQEMVNPFSNMSLELWKKWVIGQRQEYLARKKLAHLTDGSGSSSWPTVTVGEEKYHINGNSQASKCLSAMAVLGELGPHDQASSRTNGKRQKSWATPDTFAFKIPESLEAWTKRAKYQKEEKGVNLHRPIHSQVLHENEKLFGPIPRSQSMLNPDWVEQLMGLPTGWTDCDYSATALSQPPQP